MKMTQDNTCCIRCGKPIGENLGNPNSICPECYNEMWATGNFDNFPIRYDEI